MKGRNMSRITVHLVLIILCVNVHRVTCWSYLHTDEWGWDCQRQEESPVNVDTARSVYDERLHSLTFKNYDVDGAVQYSMVNTGHSLEVFVRSEEGLNISLSGATLPGNYKLEQFHFHWGNVSSYGSEHTFNGDAFPLEMHLVHWNLKYDNILEASLHPNGLAILAVLFDVTEPPVKVSTSIAMEHIIRDIERPEILEADRGEVKLKGFKMSALLPGYDRDGHRMFYKYHGSLTTPPCTESVLWHVFRSPLEISEQYLTKFRQLRNIRGESMSNNHRQVQPLHRRTIYRSVEVQNISPSLNQDVILYRPVGLILLWIIFQFY